MTVSVDDIVDRMGGLDATARRLGVGTEAVRKWRQSHVIPSRHFSALIAATGLTWADMPGAAESNEVPAGASAVLMLADGTRFWGVGFGAHTRGPDGGGPDGGGPDWATGEVCFSTGMSGYQETLTDPSFASQIITFTFPHIGNVGSNIEDMEAAGIAAAGLVVKQDITEPANWRSTQPLQAWLIRQNIPGIAGVDTRALTLRIRDGGAPTGVIAFPSDGRFDLPALQARAAEWPGLAGMDLAKTVSCTQSYEWQGGVWTYPDGFVTPPPPRYHVVAVDYGAKRNILRSLAAAGCRVTVVPATATGDDIFQHKPDGVFLSNGPGDPAATGVYAVPAIQAVLAAGTPLFGICLGHQLLAIALGGRTYKLSRGHRGANQPVKELSTGKVEITSQNHGFAVDETSLPAGVKVTHVSLFDGSNEGLAVDHRPVFSVQYHPEASPGPTDARHLFRRFTTMMDAHG